MKKTETKSLVLLQHHLKQLKLPTMLAECEKVAGRCAADNVDHLGFLLQLAELELIDRERRAADRRLKAANRPSRFDSNATPITMRNDHVSYARSEPTARGGPIRKPSTRSISNRSRRSTKSSSTN